MIKKLPDLNEARKLNYFLPDFTADDAVDDTDDADDEVVDGTSISR